MVLNEGKPNWQANANGVDLNHNYDALWEVGKAAEVENGIFGPGPTRYSGETFESESESRAVANFSRSMNFDLVIALHSRREHNTENRVRTMYVVTNNLQWELKCFRIYFKLLQKFHCRTISFICSILFSISATNLNCVLARSRLCSGR